MSKFTIGSDPEFFIRNSENNKLVSAVPLIAGTKHAPEVMPSGSLVQHDNVSAEFATPISNTGDELIDAIGKAMAEVRAMLPPRHDIEAIPSAVFDDDQLDTDAAKEFGCESDYDAWNVRQNPEPSVEDANFRSCGGHVHVGFVKGSGNDFLLDFDGKILTVKTMDTFHGIISVVLDHSKEAIARRSLYGAAGCHRPKDYGVEYRSLSNFWMKSPTLVMLIHSLTEDCLRLIRESLAEDLVKEIGDDVIQDVINDGKVETAKEIIENHLMEHLSEDSKHYLEECTEKIDTFDFKNEWAAY